MSSDKTTTYPIVEEIKGGWSAKAKWWAVHAPTKEEVIRKYEERKRYYEWLATQPYAYELGNVEGDNNG